MKHEQIVVGKKYLCRHHIGKHAAIYRVRDIIQIPENNARKNRRMRFIYQVVCLQDGLQTAFRSVNRFLKREGVHSAD